ncbi:MAG: hypothetical protein ABSD56_00820 [Bryobacteraceae bacterium]
MLKWLLMIIAALVLAVVLFWDRVVGIPFWLEALGILPWIRRLDPLDKWLPAFLATVIALYAIFHETLWKHWRRPKLRTDPVPNCIAIPVYVKMPGDYVGVVPSFQVRLVVKNEGAERAESVEVYAAALKEETDGVLKPCEWFLPMNLKWANEDATYTGISANVERVCNVLAIWQPSPHDKPPHALSHAPNDFEYGSKAVVRIHTVVQPSSFSSVVFPGSYKLDLVVAARNAENQHIRLHFSFDGRWFEDQPQMFSAAVMVWTTVEGAGSRHSHRAGIKRRF